MLNTFKQWVGFNPIKWISDTRHMRSLVSAFLTNTVTVSGPCHIGVVITPWSGTFIPWYSLATGLFLSRSKCKVTFLIDDSPFGGKTFRFHFILSCIRYVIQPLKTKFKIIELSTIDSASPLTLETLRQISQFAELNATWELKGEMEERGRRKFEARCQQQFRRAYPSIDCLLKPKAFDALFIPGGVWGTSGIWSHLARQAGIRIGSFDAGGYGTVMIAGNGVACQLQDIPAAFGILTAEQQGRGSLELAKRHAIEEMGRRRAGVDAFESQVQGSGDGDSRYDNAVMLALNSSWDSAALGLHNVFKNNSDWILQSVRHLLEDTEATVIVRQHPAERLEIAKTSDNYAELLHRQFGSHSRLHFIGASDKVNSYELMSRLRALIVYTSTIGIEAVANGVPVVTASDSYYSELGFVFKADKLKVYQDLLSKAASGELVVSEEMKDKALIAYYLTQCCNWIFSDFNPWDFHTWKKKPLEIWLSDENVGVIINTLRDGTPVACFNHNKKRIQATETQVL